MNFDLYDINKDITKYNYWNISKKEFELIKKHINNLEYFKFPTKNILNDIINGKNYDKINGKYTKKLLLNTEYEQDIKNVLEIFKKYSTIRYNHDMIDLVDLFSNYFNIKLDSIFYIINENKVNFQELKKNQDLFNIKAQLFIENNSNNFEFIKKQIIIECKNKNLNNILILRGDFIFNDGVIKHIINSNLKINIPDNYTEFYLDYIFENFNYRYSKYINFISSYNINQSSIINLKSNEYNYYGIFPLLNKNINLKKETLIKKFNYMKNKFTYQTLFINLQRRQDRFDRFINTYGDIYPNIIKFAAIDGKNFNFNPYKNIFDISEYNKYKNIKNMYTSHRYLKGALGCAMSHYTIWELIIKNDSLKENDYILVLEDDIDLVDNFNVKLNNLLEYAHFDIDWDVIFLGFTNYHEDHEKIDKHVRPDLAKYFKNLEDTKINDMLIKFSPGLRLNGGGTFAYFIRKKAAKKYLEYAKKYKIQQPVDWFMIEFFDRMTVYKCEPELVLSHIANNKVGADSDVQNLSDIFQFK